MRLHAGRGLVGAADRYEGVDQPLAAGALQVALGKAAAQQITAIVPGRKVVPDVLAGQFAGALWPLAEHDDLMDREHGLGTQCRAGRAG